MALINFYSNKDAHNLGINSELQSTFVCSECRNNHLLLELKLTHTHNIPYRTPNTSYALKIHTGTVDRHSHAHEEKKK